MTNNKFVYLKQIDLLKGLAIISVIVIHTLPLDLLVKIYSQFHIWQAVPIFFILMGFNSGLSFNRKHFVSIKTFNWKSYLIKKYKRIFAPFLITFIISLLYGLSVGKYYIGFGYFIGYLPSGGPGNYFITILFQYVLITPFIYFIYRRSPKIMVLIFFSIDILFQLISPYSNIFVNNPYLYSACILRYFSAISLGFYISDEFRLNNQINILNKKNKFILIGLVLSIIYLFLARFIIQPFPLFIELWKSQNVLSFFYPLIIVIFVLNCNIVKYEKNILFRYLIKIGKSSYHIFLVQILFFGFGLSINTGIIKNNLSFMGPISVFTNLFFIIIIGHLFYMLQMRNLSHKGYNC